MKNKTWRQTVAGTLTTVALACQAQPVPPAPPAQPAPPTLPVLPRPAPAPEPASAAEPLDLKAPVRPALAARDGVSVRVERFVVSGNTRLPADQVAAALAPFEQRTLGFADLAAAADAVTALYRQRGWLLALAYLPEQQIRDGAVEITVLEGRLGSLAIGAAPAGVDRALAASVAQWAIGNGDVIGEANLVRNLLVLNEWAGIAVAADVRPGRQVGTADVTVDLREAAPKLSGTASVDTLGSKATGRLRLGASVTARELAGRGDQFGAQMLYGTEGGLSSGAVSYGVMLHPSGTRLTASLSRLDYKLVDPAFTALDARGDATYLQVSLDQPLLRRVGDAVTLRTGLVGKRLHDRVAAFAQREDRHIENLQLGLFGEHGGRGAPATRWNLGVVIGRLGFHDTTAANADQALRQTAGRFGKLNLDVSHERPLSDTFTMAGRLSWQKPIHRNLDPAERAVLGGAGPLRPYGELSTQADDVVQGSVEARWRTSAGSLPLTASVFFDRGVGRADQAPATAATQRDNGVRAMLLGVGAELQLPGDTTLRLAFARQNAQSGADRRSEWAKRGWVELVKAF